MMNRGIVMEMDPEHIVVMTPNGNFKRVRVPKSQRSYRIGEEIQFPAKQDLFSFRSPKFAISAAVIFFIIVFSAFGLFGGGQEVVAYVTMDINPSIELGIDAGEHVIQVKGLNEDGQKLINGLRYKGKLLDEVTRDIIEEARQQKYLAKANADIVITSTVVDQKAKVDEQKIAEDVKQQVNQLITADRDRSAPDLSQKIVVKALSAPKEVRDEAVRKGVSTGKMAIKLIAQKKAGDIPIEQLKTHSIHDVVEKLGGIEKLLDTDPKTIGEELKQMIEQEKKQQDTEKDKRKKAGINRQHNRPMNGDNPSKLGNVDDKGKDTNNDTEKGKEQNKDNSKEQNWINTRFPGLKKPSGTSDNPVQEGGKKEQLKENFNPFKDFWNQDGKLNKGKDQNSSKQNEKSNKQQKEAEAKKKEAELKKKEAEQKKKDIEVKKKEAEVKKKDTLVKPSDSHEDILHPYESPGISVPDFRVSKESNGEPASKRINEQKAGAAELISDKAREKADKQINKQTQQEEKQQTQQEEEQQTQQEEEQQTQQEEEQQTQQEEK